MQALKFSSLPITMAKLLFAISIDSIQKCTCMLHVGVHLTYLLHLSSRDIDISFIAPLFQVILHLHAIQDQALKFVFGI